MTKPPKTDVAASIRQRLLNQARETGQDFNRVLVRYGIERLLYRLSQLGLRDRFALKGAMLFATWADAPFRATGDLDLLGFGDPGVEIAKSAFKSLCSATVDADDGLVFLAETVAVERTREDEEYQGLHVRLEARLKATRIPILIDIRFGDVVHPAPIDVDYPRLLQDIPLANIRAYPPATVIAEKFDAMVRFGEQATRLKDHYNIWAIAETFPFEAATLIAAVRQTMAQRGRDIPTDWPGCLTDAFAADPRTLAQWNAFLRRTAPTLEPPPLAELVTALRTFLEPVLASLQPDAEAATETLAPDTGWR